MLIQNLLLQSIKMLIVILILKKVLIEGKGKKKSKIKNANLCNLPIL